MKRHSSLPGLLCVTAIAAAFAGCSTLRSAPVADGHGIASSTPASLPQDSALAQNVRDQLARDLPLSEIDVKTAQGKVELTGTVEDADAARRAVKGALAVEGVRGVVNDLKVAPEGDGRGPALSASTL